MIVVSFTKKATTSVKTFQVSEETIQVSLETGEMSEKTASLCRQVNDAAGLTVQKRPTPNSPKVGTIDPNQRVKLIEGYEKLKALKVVKGN